MDLQLDQVRGPAVQVHLLEVRHHQAVVVDQAALVVAAVEGLVVVVPVAEQVEEGRKTN